MEKYYYEKEFLKRIKKLNVIRRKSHPNEYPIIDDTIRTMEIIIADAKRPKKKTLIESIEDDYEYLKDNNFLWNDVRKFATLSVPEYYGDFVLDNFLDLTDEEIFQYTHDFYRDITDKEMFELFLKIFAKRNKQVKLFQEKYSDFTADSVYLAYYNDTFIRLNKKGTFTDLASLIHEYGHAIQMYSNYHPNMLDNPYNEIISVTFELIAHEYYSKDERLCISAADSQWEDFNSRILFADDLVDEIDIVKQIKDGEKGHSLKEKISKYAKHDARLLQEIIEFEVATSLDYVVAELIGIEIYMIYRKDPEKALYLIHKIIDIDPRLDSKEYFKKLIELGLHLNKSVGEYNNHLLKRMRTIQKKDDEKNA